MGRGDLFSDPRMIGLFFCGLGFHSYVLCAAHRPQISSCNVAGNNGTKQEHRRYRNKVPGLTFENEIK